MKILIISPYPLFDRAAGDLRLFQLIRMMAARNEVYFCPVGQTWQVQYLGTAGLNKYSEALEDSGVQLLEPHVPQALGKERFDVVFFEFYYHAMQWLKQARLYQPSARMVIDSVDIHFLRLKTKATLTGSPKDEREALLVRQNEIATYGASDLVITVTDRDAGSLLAEIPGIPTATLPTIHPLYDPVMRAPGGGPKLIFVGGFRHEPNADAVCFFLRDIWPHIVASAPHASIDIVGADPPDEVRAFSGPAVTVHGWIPDTAPLLRNSHISIAPLRFGAGMKGKVGEAMAHGLPVVATSVGAEGMGFSDGRELLIADDAEAFSRAVLSLHKDQKLWERIRMAGWHFIRAAYSKSAIDLKLQRILDGLLQSHPRRSLSPLDRLHLRLQLFHDRHIRWRFQ